jgi:hypothetical protein
MPNRTFDNGNANIKFVENTENNNWYKCKIYPNGGKYYFDRNGAYHRLDGPAIIYPGGKELYYVNGHNASKWFEERGLNITDMTEYDWMIFNTEMCLIK